jgi:cytochrome c553
MNVPLPWERLLWSGRPLRLSRLAGERYFLTDFRLVRVAGDRLDELVLHDIGEIQRTESSLDRILGTSTLIVRARPRSVAPIVLASVRSGAPLAALLEILSGDPHASLDGDAVRAALAWHPRGAGVSARRAFAPAAALFLTVFAVAISLHGKTATLSYEADDPIAPGGNKRSRAEVIQFMETDVMPWARQTFARLKGGSEHVTCETCHGADAGARDWQMPAVAVLPVPYVREAGWETYSGGMDAQMRNAIYGYLADSDKQTKAGYMREIVMPGMSRLLHRPAYDFAQPYDYNRSRRALGCYHCHMVR